MRVAGRLSAVGATNIERLRCGDNGVINALGDGLYLLQFGFLGGTPPPPPPFPECGADPTHDGLACDVSTCP